MSGFPVLLFPCLEKAAVFTSLNAVLSGRSPRAPPRIFAEGFRPIIEETPGRRRNNHESETVPGISPFCAFQACAGLPAFSALHLAHSIWQLSRTVRPPLHHGVTWSASISEYSKCPPQTGHTPFWRS